LSAESGEAVWTGAPAAGLRDRPPEGETERCVRLARHGDVGAFERLYRSHVGRVYALCLRLLGDPDAAEDAVQEAFLRAWTRLASFERRSAFSTWLHRLAVNVVLDRHRAAKRRPLDLAADPAEGALERVAAAGSRPDGSIDLERAIAALPPGARTAFVLHEVEGYRHREIAEMTGTAEGTWKAQLHRARHLLKEALAR
jgi:RNA polymerase sigma-70 factor (ECF subfamily)